MMNHNWSEEARERGSRDEHPTETMGQAPPPPPPTSASPYWSDQQPSEPLQHKTRRFGWPVLITGVVLAGVLGGGAGGIAVHYAGSTGATSSESVQESPQLNRSEDVTPTTEAAATASPSVVTLSVGGDEAQGSGSGVILDKEGHILTNSHVVTLGGQTAAANVQVQTSEGQVHQAEVVGTDPLSDLAVIKIDAEGLSPIEMGSAKDLNVGDQAVAIGAPMGLSGTVTEGIISNLDRTISVSSSAVPEEPEMPEQESPFEFGLPENQEVPAEQGQIHLNVIQSDAAINPGNSGGALVDQAGRLIGINVAIATRTEGNVGLGFAIPAEYAQRVADELIENGEASHGMLGVSIVPSGDANISAGARVVEVVEDGPAAGADLESDDIITAIDGKSVTDPGSLSATVRQYSAGSEVELTVVRDGEEFTETLQLGSMS
ncbi:MAG: S1C family serine protease [Yaniella sp.]|uniref:S1C family serine protease n=1 Tax=Yaniella sp. TaxID=2773929 RepID=UPI003F9C0738